MISDIVACSSKLQAIGSIQPVQVLLSPPHTPQSSINALPPQTPLQSNNKPSSQSSQGKPPPLQTPQVSIIDPPPHTPLQSISIKQLLLQS